LQLLELGRGILASLQLEIRSDISVLASNHPELAHQFEDLRNLIDSPAGTSQLNWMKDKVAGVKDEAVSAFISNRRNWLTRLDDLMAEIRAKDGFENFLQGPSKSELLSLAEGGPIVVFNVSDLRSDTFLINDREIRFVQLPLLTSDSVDAMAGRFLRAIHNKSLRLYNDSKQEVDAVLKWLWDAGVCPILGQLGLTQIPHDGPRPRVWWVGNGLLNILPIHASGYHDSSPPKTALDFVISSYASTVKSLAYSRERNANKSEEIRQRRAILIAMPVTPEQDDLLFVETEIKHLEALFSKTPIDLAVLRNPTRVDVLSKLPQFGVVHFSCHGISAEDPSQSSLLLKDWKNSPLTVSDLTSLNIESPKFAFLSACHTSAMRDIRLLDESIHLSSAIQLSGYPSVVGSLWEVGDHSAHVATVVYEWILSEGGINAERAAEGLHKAVRDLRDRTRVRERHDPLIWAPYIHVGI
jgi:hypothetical protein